MNASAPTTSSPRPGARADLVSISQRWPAALGGAVFLFVAVLVAFSPVRHNGFINYDDDLYVTENRHVQAGLNGETATWAWRNFDAGNWHPLTWISHMADCQIFGLNAAGHHGTNVLLHATSTVLLFLLLRGMSGASWRSFFVAALFGLHPIRVESVAWISERKDVLSTLFFLLTLLAYAKYAGKRLTERNEGHEAAGHEKVQKGTKNFFSRGCIFYGLALVFFAFGLMCKPMLVTTPFVLLLLDYWPLRRLGKGMRPVLRLAVEKLPFFVLAGAVSVVTWMAQRHGGAIEGLARLSLQSRIENALVSYGRYLAKLAWPSQLSICYPPTPEWPAALIGLTALLLVMISVAVWIMRRQQSWLLTGWLWWVGMLVPVIGLVQVGYQSIADRYTYLPSIGLFIAVVWGISEYVGRRLAAPARMLVAGGGCCALVILGASTWRQVGYWKDSGTLFQHALAVTGRNAVAELQLGMFQMNRGETAPALEHLEAAIAIEPRLPQSHDALGTDYYLRGRRTEAISQFEQAIALKPDYAVAHFNLAVALQATGNLDAAARHFEEALAARPDYAEACSGLGIVLAQQSKLQAAIDRFEQALTLDPNLPVVHYNLGLALLKAGQRDRAAEHFARAIALRPDYTEAKLQLQVLQP